MIQFENDIKNYVSVLNESSDLSHLKISVTFSSHDGFGIKWEENSMLMLKGSKSAFSNIKKKAVELYDVINEKKPVLIKVTFTKNDKKNIEDLKKDRESVLSDFISEIPKFKLEDVVLEDSVKKSVEEAIATIKNFDIVYNKWNFRSIEPSIKTNICFWGLPGTGKTMCAHAMANHLGKKILIASYADIQSEYVGVGPKNLKKVFQQAEKDNAMLFFDEADSFLRKRTSDVSNAASMHYNSMTNEMMKHLEDFNGVVIFATNLTENTDDAFKTRISFSIEFKAPDEQGRALIIEKMIPSQVPLETSFSMEDYLEMAKVCDGFVGRDIRNAVKTILSVGAQYKKYPFTKEQFIEGFKEYHGTKSNFDKSVSKKKDSTNPMDLYTANGCIYTILTYAAWFDGPENDLETEHLRLYSNLFSRSKLVITKISDLPDIEEICHGLVDEKLKIKAMIYLAEFFAKTKQPEENISLFTTIGNVLRLDDEVINNILEYVKIQKKSEEFKECLI